MNQTNKDRGSRSIDIKEDNHRDLVDSRKKDHLAVSSVLNNPEHPQEKQMTLQKLIDFNEKYLMSKVKISDVRKPSPYSFKMPSKTGNSQYNRKYATVQQNFSLEQSNPKRDLTGSLSKFANAPIAGYLSTYHFDYDKKKNENDNIFKAQIKDKKKYEKMEGPTFNQTSYNRDFIAPQCSPIESVKRMDTQLMGGGKFTTNDTTYQHNFYEKTKQTGQNSKPVIHKDHKIFVKVNNNQKSSYQDSFPNKSKTKQQKSFKPIQKYNPTANKMKYKTEYNQTFVSQKMDKKIDFNCLTKQELKKYVMTILQD